MTVVLTKHSRIFLQGGAYLDQDGDTLATPPDTEAPTVPTGLIVTNVGSQTARLTYSASTDNVGVSGYEGKFVSDGNVTNFGNAISVAVSNLVSATSYSAQVRAYDAAGNRSDWSSTVPFITLNTGSATTKSILMLYGDVSKQGYIPSSGDPSFPTPYHQMLWTDTSNDGFSGIAAYITGSPDASGNWYQVSQAYDQTFNPSTDLAGVDVVFFCSTQRAWSASHISDFVSFVSGGGGFVFLSDSALGGEWWRVGAQNTVGQSARNPLIQNFGMQVYVDQASGIKTINLNQSSSLAKGESGLQFRGEGVSPIRIDSAATNSLAKGKPRSLAGFGEVPGKTNNITYTGPICAIAASYYGNGVVIGVFDRNGYWNAGAGSNYTEVDNAFVYRAIFEHAAGVIPRPADLL